ncbi:Dual specificity protein phosphatase Mpk3 [Gryllus bimaculatus]|nr:Dual specificity protein phosphatase Mpk3 [Gryllus bimaculatus]
MAFAGASFGRRRRRWQGHPAAARRFSFGRRNKANQGGGGGGGGAGQVARVCEGLLLCAASALRVERVRALGVTRVLSAAPELPDTPLPPGVALERVALRDCPDADLARHLDPVADAVLQERERGGTTLIHCVAGVSRSAALCLAFLVKHLRMPLRKAFAHLRARRPCVRPNAGFFRQLIDFERRTLGAASVAMLTHKALCIPDVYEPEYRATLCLQRQFPRSLGRH